MSWGGIWCGEVHGGLGEGEGKKGCLKGETFFYLCVFLVRVRRRERVCYGGGG